MNAALYASVSLPVVLVSVAAGFTTASFSGFVPVRACLAMVVLVGGAALCLRLWRAWEDRGLAHSTHTRSASARS